MVWRRHVLETQLQKRVLLLFILLLLLPLSIFFLCSSSTGYPDIGRFALITGVLFRHDTSFNLSSNTHVESPNVTAVHVNGSHRQTFFKSHDRNIVSDPTVPVMVGQTGEPTKRPLQSPRVAICLVGGARRFELTGRSLLDRVVNVFNDSDLFLNCPFDNNSYKLSLLKGARRIAAVRIAEQKTVPETDVQKQVLTSQYSPNGLQGLLQYFSLVEGCLQMIEEYQPKNQIRYNWIVRTRVDTYWSSALDPNIFVPGTYMVPFGAGYGGLNDRFGVGDPNTSRSALSRMSLIPHLFDAGYRNLNSERAFKLQLEIQGTRFQEIHVPFCVLSERGFLYPPLGWNTPVASMASSGPLSGAYCRPCSPACKGKCASDLLEKMDHHFNWIDGDPELCNGYGRWEKGWEKIFDRSAGEGHAKARIRVRTMDLDQCIADLEEMRSRTDHWDAPSPSKICRSGSIKK